MQKTKETLNRGIEILKSIKKPYNIWRGVLHLSTTKNMTIKRFEKKLSLIFFAIYVIFSAFDVLSIQNDNITVKQLADILPNDFKSFKDDIRICERLKIEALYEKAIAEQENEVNSVRKEEKLIIPNNIDYFA